jgi:hypothetical protein
MNDDVVLAMSHVGVKATTGSSSVCSEPSTQLLSSCFALSTTRGRRERCLTRGTGHGESILSEEDMTERKSCPASARPSEPGREQPKRGEP